MSPSPLLFAMALEPLAARVRASPDVVGFWQAGWENKLSLYVNDTLIYLGDTADSLKVVMRLNDQFGQLSRFVIN